MDVKELAENIKSKMATRKLTSNKIINRGMAKKQVYSVLQMGKHASANYQVSTLLRFLELAELELYEVCV